MEVDGARIYWADAGTETNPNTIARAKLDGTGARLGFIAGGSDPADVAVDASHVYWANYASSSIGRSNLDGSAVNNNFMDLSNFSLPRAVAIDGAHVYWADQGAAQRSAAPT